MSPSEWKALHGAHAILEFGRAAPTLLQSESLAVITIAWVAMSLFARNSTSVKKMLIPNSTKFESCEHHELHTDARRIGKALREDLESRCGVHKVTDIEKIAMVLDPRPKDLKSSWCPFNTEEKEDCWTMQWALADSLVKTMAKAHHKADAAASDQGAPDKQHHYNVLDDAFSALDGDHDSGLVFEEGELHSELQDWRSNGVCVGTKKMTSHDPFQFCKERREAYPTLHLAAMLVLGGMASAARVERTSRFWVEKSAWKRRKNMSFFFLAQSTF